MSFCEYSSEAVINDKVEIDNIFINDFLPYAPENAVRVYLYGLYMCSHASSPDNVIESFAKTLNLTESQILEAFEYWQECGLIQILSTFPKQIRFMPVKNFINNTNKFNKSKYAGFNKQAQEIIKGRMITPNEYAEYYTILERFHFEQQALTMIMAYCVYIKGDNVNYPYILTVAKNWAQEGVLTADKVEEKIKDFELQSSEIKQVYKSLGKTSKPNFSDYDLYVKWTKIFGFTEGVILHVAKTLKQTKRNANIETLDAELLKFFENKLTSIIEINEYLSQKASLKELAISVVKALGLYYENIETVVENYLVIWKRYGFTDDSLISIANYCFKKSIRTLEGMNTTLLKLYKLGLLDDESIQNYIASLSITDASIKNILNLLGLERAVNSMDRDFYNTWKSAWGVKDDLLTYGCEISKNKAFPMQFLNKILAKWQENSICSVEQAKEYTTKFETKIINNFATAGKSFNEQDISVLFDKLDEIDI